jgi:hypothetical protein
VDSGATEMKEASVNGAHTHGGPHLNGAAHINGAHVNGAASTEGVADLEPLDELEPVGELEGLGELEAVGGPESFDGAEAVDESGGVDHVEPVHHVEAPAPPPKSSVTGGNGHRPVGSSPTTSPPRSDEGNVDFAIADLVITALSIATNGADDVHYTRRAEADEPECSEAGKPQP